jgi:hypothetical protein
VSTRSGRKRGGGRPRRWAPAPPDCWCGWRAVLWLELLAGGQPYRRLPVCQAHADPETMPVFLKLAIAAEMADDGVQTISDGRGWTLGPVVTSETV